MSDKEPVTIADFQNAWKKIVVSENESKDMPIHNFGKFRFRQDNKDFCNICNHHQTGGTQFRYSNKLCFGKRRWWFFGRRLCPQQSHFHVRCSICNASWFESMRVEKK